MDSHTNKEYRSGTHRLISPRETLERVRPFLAEMGITRLANVTGLDTIGIPVVMACRPNSRSLAVAQGKGLDLDAAKASAVMESIEGYHAERITLPLKLVSYRELTAGHCVVNVERLPRADDSSFHPNLPILWIEGDDWQQNEKTWVPYQMVHTAYTANLYFDVNSFAANSTGLASGNHLLEAVSHAICEVVERDASAQWTRISDQDREGRRIDLDTVDQHDCRQLLERCDRAGVAVAVWEITGEIGIAAFECVIAQRDDDPLRRLYGGHGAGCHPVRHIAFLRALTEAAQSRLTAISGARDDMPRSDYIGWRDSGVLDRLRLQISPNGARRFSDVPSFEAESFEEDVTWELDRLRQAGFDRAIVIDLTRPEFGWAVARVLIPGMEIRRTSREVRQ
jgi:YcaO-like protein with predicted kinase domain